MSQLSKAKAGLIGLGVMGRNLALNLLNHQVPLAVYSYAEGERNDFAASLEGKEMQGSAIQDSSLRDLAEVTHSLENFVASLDCPRVILMMVTAGDAVDSVISDLLPHLCSGDILIDGGNSHYKDTMRREVMLKQRSLNYIGTGISGGEQGARNGASLMVGGSVDAFELAKPVFAALSTEAKGEPCFGHVGSDGAGHFVKMVHNGIEYGVMQLIAESYHFKKRQLGESNSQIAETYSGWNEGRLRSYLLDITADIFHQRDDLADGDLIDVISDRAGQKGTGRWTVDAAMELGVAVPGIVAAVTERQISGFDSVRQAAPGITQATLADMDRDSWNDKLENALYVSSLLVYVQGLSLIQSASEEYGWQTDLSQVIRLWRGGCIIRAEMLETLIIAANEKNPLHLVLSSVLQGELQSRVNDWREVVSSSILSGLPLPAMAASLNYVSSLHTSHLPLNLVQAQRDYFGAHTYQRRDRPGVFHTDWVAKNTKG
jgi:6-phosphogluconate dehydrogenase